MKIFINHLGYETPAYKKSLILAPENSHFTGFSLQTLQGEEVYEGSVKAAGTVDRWKNWFFWEIDFSDFKREGRFRIVVNTDSGEVCSEAFDIRERLLSERCVSDILMYFKSQRCSGKVERADKSVPFVGERKERVDAHGGWYDASGDFSKYLSHLSYANYMNPQQTPMVIWNSLHAGDMLEDSESSRLNSLVELMREEALYGADFLMRMQDPDGYFYMTLFDKWSKDVEQREICAYETKKGHKTDAYQSGYRQGGGLTIAALARVSALGITSDYSPAQYLAAAEKGLMHLEAHNIEYLDDGKENIIDDYCALLAASELYQVTQQSYYLEIARRRQEALMGRLTQDERYAGWWRADDSGERPFFHAAEAGLPVIALLRYLDVETDSQRKSAVLEVIHQSLEFELAITNEVSNPFGYARQYVKDLGGGKRGAFFFPHNNESGYWWQGENARLGSLAAAAFLGSRVFSHEGQGDEAFRQKLRKYAVDQLDWILGLNPYDICMLQGQGRNNPDYLERFPNAPGGVCNGITSGFDDERDIDFLPEKYADGLEESWRWSEQWIPHGAWLLLALAASAK